MYIEKEYLIKKIDEYCNLKNITLSFQEKYDLSSAVSLEFDKDRFLTFDEFMELLDHNIDIENFNDIDFEDEIIDIIDLNEEIDMIDFNVSGNKLFFANNLLTHNSAVNNVDNTDNSAISDSLGTAMTADFMLFLLQNEEMKVRKEFVLKCTKNRYTGRTDTWMMNIDYEHMRFHDMVTENSIEHTKMIEDLANQNKPTDALDFGIVTADKMKSANEFATQEVKDIISKDMEILQKEKSNPLMDDTAELFRQLGI